WKQRRDLETAAKEVAEILENEYVHAVSVALTLASAQLAQRLSRAGRDPDLATVASILNRIDASRSVGLGRLESSFDADSLLRLHVQRLLRVPAKKRRHAIDRYRTLIVENRLYLETVLRAEALRHCKEVTHSLNPWTNGPPETLVALQFAEVFRSHEWQVA